MTRTVRALLVNATALMGLVLGRRWQLRWGATNAEVAAPMPGDSLLARVDRNSTRAVTILAPPALVWPWIAQMGQGRGGLYSYDFAENLIGCDIHSADHVVEEWQHVAVGDRFGLHPDIALEVVSVEPGHALVVRGGIPIGARPAPYDCTWSFVLNEAPDGNTRLVVRERYTFTKRWAALIVEPVLPISFVMTRKMLDGIRTRAERSAPNPSTLTPPDSTQAVKTPGVYLYWLPLGAGARVVRLSGRAFEMFGARLHHRHRRDLYHSALEVITQGDRFVVEMTPVPAPGGVDRGVVGEAAVGTRWLRRLRVFRYEIHRWRDGVIPDLRYAVGSPVQVSNDPAVAAAVLGLALSTPMPVWGRDELHAGEMWNSNSVTSWLLSRGGVDMSHVQPPPNGRAPGWDAGLAVARRGDPNQWLQPASYRAEFRRRSDAALSQAITADPVTELELARLPEPVAAYVRLSGAVGQPRVLNLHAQISGRIRSGPDKRWMPFHGEQVNTFGADPVRLFYIDATMLGLPLAVLHVFAGTAATMRVKALSLFPVVNQSGPEMDRAETVTVFNDLCVLAPSALVDAAIEWQPIDNNRARGAFTRGGQTVSAVLVFNDAHELVDFHSDDRGRSSPDGKHTTPERWSTPLRAYRWFHTTRIASHGDGRWRAPAGEFTYIEFNLDAIDYNAHSRELTQVP